MQATFKLTVTKESGSILTLTGFTASHSLQVNFGKSHETNEYCFTFINNLEYSKLHFTFVSELELYSYFKFATANGDAKYVGYKSLKDSAQTVDISEWYEFSIIIPKEKNEDIRTLLTLIDIKVS